MSLLYDYQYFSEKKQKQLIFITFVSAKKEFLKKKKDPNAQMEHRGIKYEFESIPWLHNGTGGWHFVSLPTDFARAKKYC